MAKRKRPIGSGPVESSERGAASGGPLDPRGPLMGRTPLSPAEIFVLMTGAPAEARLKGWVALAQVPLADLERHLRAAWTGWREELTREASRHDFEPAGLGRKHPMGSGFARWRTAFLTKHTY